MHKVCIVFPLRFLAVAAVCVTAAAAPAPPPLSRPDARAAHVQDAQRASAAARARAETFTRAAGIPARGMLKEGRLYEVADFVDGVLYVNITDNHNAAITTAAAQIRNTPPWNVSGAGHTVGVWDGGAVRPTHVELNGRVTVLDGAAVIDHATHVAGTIAAGGAKASARGMAPNVRILSHDWNDDLPEMALQAMAVSGEPGKIQISNHSYSFIAGWANQFAPPRWYGTWGLGRKSDLFGIYNAHCAAWDALCEAAPYYLPFKSAGNDRTDTAPANGATFQYFSPNLSTGAYDPNTHPLGDGQGAGGYDTIPVRGNCKNVVTVGAVHDAVVIGMRNLGNATMATFSGWGPADDGRVKPDLVANGLSLESSIGTHDAAYGFSSGTSMSSPNAAGSAALLVELHANLFAGASIRASTLKGLLLHTADDLGRPGPDYQFGWGLMNVRRAADLLRNHAALPQAGYLREDSLTPASRTNEHTIYWNGSDALRFTLCWTDPAGPARSGLDNREPVLVHDLDLLVIGPTGSVHHPYVLNATNPTAVATTGRNEVDNIEQVEIPAPGVTGVWTVVVSYTGDLVRDAQAYALVADGITVPPAIVHIPLLNTTNQVDPVTVEATITPASLLNTNLLHLCWNTTGPTNGFATNLLENTGGNTYASTIPAQPLGATVWYFLRAVSTIGLTTEHPVNAPAALHSFLVVEPVSVTVTSTPPNLGVATPPYGVTSLPWGNPVHASAGPATPVVDGLRHSVTGWTGLGVAPASGATNAVEYLATGDSTLIWHWTPQAALLQTSSVPGLLSATTWHTLSSTGSTLTAATDLFAGGTNFAFAQWSVDGARWPDATNRAANPAGDIPLYTARVAVATYLPATLDADADGIPDWWELYHFGTTDVAPDDDFDGDGFSAWHEAADGSDPRDPLSIPASPFIAHTPLAHPHPRPAPFVVQADVTDNHAVAAVALKWKRTDLPFWNSAAMTNVPGTDCYAAVIPAPGTNGHAFTYLIQATDAAGFEAFDGAHAFTVSYPILRTEPPRIANLLLRPEGTAQTNLTLHNDGAAPLTWTWRFDTVGLDADMEDGAPDWTHSGAGDRWHVSQLKAFSPSNAWYCGDPATVAYLDSFDASLVTPPVRLGPYSELTFWHWPQFETKNATVTWDGARVELSTNAGTHWVVITPVGGYPYTTEPHGASPFQPNVAVPCFSGTGGWRRATFDLSPWAGQEAVVRFRAAADAFVVDVGWFVDDVRILPDSAGTNWLALTPVADTVAPASTGAVAVVADALGYPTGDRAAWITLESNDPLHPTHSVPVVVHVRSPPSIADLAAAQTSTNGAGLVTVSLAALDPDGEPLTLRLQASTDNGVSWTSAWISAAQADVAPPLLTTNPPAATVQTLVDGGTGNVWLTWNTLAGPAPVTLATGVLVRILGADAWDTVAATSQPFLVDNAAPGAVTGLLSTTHAPWIWSASNSVRAIWQPADDGAGIGVAGYAVGLSSPAPALPGAQPHTAATSSVHVALADGSNIWFNIRPIDAYGNAGPASSIGPFHIDTTPPDTTTAFLVFEPDNFSHVGGVVTGAWSGFTDAGSGLVGYYTALTELPAPTGGVWTTATQTSFAGLALDATNRVYVWATDALGHLSAPVSRALLALSPGGDWDEDGMSNAAEALAGTDPNNFRDRLQLHIAPGTNGLPRLTWLYRTNRIYIVHRADGPGVLTPTHAITNPPVQYESDAAIWTDTTAPTSHYYRLQVLPEP